MHEHDVLCFGETMAMFVAEQTGELAQVGDDGPDPAVAIADGRISAVGEAAEVIATRRIAAAAPPRLEMWEGRLTAVL